jgi:hypothetical protein
VLIARCAWHRRYYGFSRLLGVSSWRGLRIDFTDGICPKCAARVRADFRGLPGGRGVPVGVPGLRDRDGWVPGIAVVALAVMIGVVLIARPIHELPAPALVALGPTTTPPPTLVIPEPPQPAASPALTPPPPLPGRATRLTMAQRPPGLALRNASQVGRRPLPRATVVYRTRAPRDSAQSP